MSPRRRSGSGRNAKKTAAGADPDSPAAVPPESREVSTQRGTTTGGEDDSASVFGTALEELKLASLQQQQQPQQEQQGQQEQQQEQQAEPAAEETAAAGVVEARAESEPESLKWTASKRPADAFSSQESGDSAAAAFAEEAGSTQASKLETDEASHQTDGQQPGDETDATVSTQALRGEADVPTQQQQPPLLEGQQQLLQGSQQQLQLQQQPPEQEQHQYQQQHKVQHQQPQQQEQERDKCEVRVEPDANAEQQQQQQQEQQQQEQQPKEFEQSLGEACVVAVQEDAQQQEQEAELAVAAVPEVHQAAAHVDSSGGLRDLWEGSDLEVGVMPAPKCEAICCGTDCPTNVCEKLFVDLQAPYGPSGRRRVFEEAKALVCDRIPTAVSRYAAEAQQDSVGDACLSCTCDAIDGCLPATRLLSELLIAGGAALGSLLFKYRSEIFSGLGCLTSSTYKCLKRVRNAQTCLCIITPPPQDPPQRPPATPWVSLGDSTELWAPFETTEVEECMQSGAALRLATCPAFAGPQLGEPARSHSAASAATVSELQQLQHELLGSRAGGSRLKGAPEFRPAAPPGPTRPIFSRRVTSNH
ncbi:hypothetical protein Efla_000220 [Eimeria flavescens]